MRDLIPQGNEGRSGWLIFIGAAGVLVILLAGLGLGVLDAKMPIVDQLAAAFR